MIFKKKSHHFMLVVSCGSVQGLNTGKHVGLEGICAIFFDEETSAGH
jgi:hypothetical protein